MGISAQQIDDLRHLVSEQKNQDGGQTESSNPLYFEEERELKMRERQEYEPPEGSNVSLANLVSENGRRISVKTTGEQYANMT